MHNEINSTMTFAATVLYVDNLTAAMAFYERAFGFQRRFYDPEWEFAELELDGRVLAFASHELGAKLMPGHYQRPANGQPAAVEIGFLTEDVPAQYQHLLDLGATPLAAPKLMPWGLTVAYVRAIDGTLIGLSTPPPAAELTELP